MLLWRSKGRAESSKGRVREGGHEKQRPACLSFIYLAFFPFLPACLPASFPSLPFSPPPEQRTKTVHLPCKGSLKHANFQCDHCAKAVSCIGLRSDGLAQAACARSAAAAAGRKTLVARALMLPGSGNATFAADWQSGHGRGRDRHVVEACPHLKAFVSGQAQEAMGGHGFGNFRAGDYHWNRL